MHADREIVKDGIVSFDYKVHDGPSTTRNAIKLLEVLDFPKDIVISAEALLCLLMRSENGLLLGKVGFLQKSIC